MSTDAHLPEPVGTVSGLWRYPVSSLAGEPTDSVAVEPNGLVGDRLFGIVEVATGEICRPDGADPRWVVAPRLRARLTEDRRLEVTIPGGDWLPAPSKVADEAVSAFLGFEAAVRPLSDAVPAGYGGPLAEARYVKAPIHLLTTASLAELRRLHPGGSPDPRRFRPNVLVDMTAPPGHFPETEWIGARLELGELRLTVSEPCRRCGFTVIAQDGFGHDPEILRSLVRFNARNIGIYCTVDRPGRVALGDRLRVLG